MWYNAHTWKHTAFFLTSTLTCLSKQQENIAASPLKLKLFYR